MNRLARKLLEGEWGWAGLPYYKSTPEESAEALYQKALREHPEWWTDTEVHTDPADRADAIADYFANFYPERVSDRIMEYLYPKIFEGLT